MTAARAAVRIVEVVRATGPTDERHLEHARQRRIGGEHRDRHGLEVLRGLLVGGDHDVRQLEHRRHLLHGDTVKARSTASAGRVGVLPAEAARRARLDQVRAEFGDLALEVTLGLSVSPTAAMIAATPIVGPSSSSTVRTLRANRPLMATRTRSRIAAHAGHHPSDRRVDDRCRRASTPCDARHRRHRGVVGHEHDGPFRRLEARRRSPSRSSAFVESSAPVGSSPSRISVR